MRLRDLPTEDLEALQTMCKASHASWLLSRKKMAFSTFEKVYSMGINAILAVLPASNWVHHARAAKEFPEGAAVVARRLMTEPLYGKRYLYTVTGWFRPDQVREDEEYWLMEKRDEQR